MIISTNFLCWKINFKRSKTIKPTSAEWDNAYQNEPGSEYKLLTKSLDRKKNQDIPRLSQDEQSIEQQLMRLIRIGEDFGKLELKRIWMQIKEVKDSMGQTGGRDHTKRWSLGRWGYKSNWDCPALTEPIQFKRGIYTKETPFSLYSFIISWKLRTIYTSTSCLSQ